MRLKKIMAALAAVALCVSSVGGATTAWAVENGGEEIVSYAETAYEASYTVVDETIVYDDYTLTFSVSDGAITITGYTSKPVDVVIPATILYEESELPVTAIGDSAFWECESLTTIDCSNAKTIGSDAFEDCDSLTTVTFGSSLETIGDSAFWRSPRRVNDNEHYTRLRRRRWCGRDCWKDKEEDLIKDGIDEVR